MEKINNHKDLTGEIKLTPFGEKGLILKFGTKSAFVVGSGIDITVHMLSRIFAEMRESKNRPKAGPAVRTR